MSKRSFIGIAFSTSLFTSLLVFFVVARIVKTRLPTWYPLTDVLTSMPMMSENAMRHMMQEMMGVSDASALPVRTIANRQARLSFELKDGVKEFKLTAEPIQWEYAKGKTVTSWGYNGQVPGPEIRVSEGDRVRIVFENKLPKGTTIHWHGIDVPNAQDGVPGVTQKAIKPGETYTYEFTAKPAGTHFYHTHGSGHSDEAQQLDMGLSGAFIIEPRGAVKPDREYTLVFDEWQTMPITGSDNDGSMMHTMSLAKPALAHEGEEHEPMMNMMNGAMMHVSHEGMGAMLSMMYNTFTINGRAFPDIEPLKVKKGESVRLRLINAGTSTSHPMHLHGHQAKIVATDGNPVPLSAQLTRNTITINPGETYDIEFVANNPGTWLFHCHELHHAGGGMIIPLQYEQ